MNTNRTARPTSQAGVPVGFYRNARGVLKPLTMLRGRPYNYATRTFGR